LKSKKQSSPCISIAGQRDQSTSEDAPLVNKKGDPIHHQGGSDIELSPSSSPQTGSPVYKRTDAYQILLVDNYCAVQVTCPVEKVNRQCSVSQILNSVILQVTKAVSLCSDRDRCHSLTFLDN
jgi:hypothetical protein